MRIACLVAPACFVVAAAVPTDANADAEEASFHVELGPAALRTGYAPPPGVTLAPGTGGADTVPAARLSLRGTWGVTDLWAFEIGLGVVSGAIAIFPGPLIPGSGSSTFQERPFGARATAGFTARFDVAWIPTVTMFTGYQLHFATGREQVSEDNAIVNVFGGESASDLVLGLGVGLDHRFDAHWIAGVSVQAVHAFSLNGQSFDAIEIPFMQAYYWYPRW